MEIRTVAGAITKTEADALVVGLFEDEAPQGDAAEVNTALGGAIAEVAGLADGEISGKAGETALLYTGGKIAARRVLVMGLGKREKFEAGSVRNVSGAALRLLRERKCRTIATALHHAAESDRTRAAEAVVEGAIRALWEPGAYKTQDNRKADPETLLLLGDDAQAGAERGRILGKSANFARDLVNEPANAMTPAVMAERAREMAQQVGLKCEILDEDAMYRLEMRSLLAVSMGSENRARLVVLTHAPNPGEPALALVGKGVTFDTGGISLKNKDGMGDMKGDMAGAAAVFGAMRAIRLLNLPVNVVGVCPLAENMPDGKAFRPGDVIRCMNGKTIEVITTDAEGRMILADALTYTERNLKSARIVDVATLTGACVVALGRVAVGAMTNDQEFLTALQKAADSAGEKTWQLPLWDEYKEIIKSDIADMKNSSGGPAGAIAGGIYLKEFVDAAPWIHLDIAGKGGADAAPHQAKGPTGVMLRTFVYLAEQLGEERR